jgi:hypothetical protein
MAAAGVSEHDQSSAQYFPSAPVQHMLLLPCGQQPLQLAPLHLGIFGHTVGVGQATAK